MTELNNPFADLSDAELEFLMDNLDQFELDIAELLVDEAKELKAKGVGLEVEVPDEPFPKSNNREDFWDRIKKGPPQPN